MNLRSRASSCAATLGVLVLPSFPVFAAEPKPPAVAPAAPSDEAARLQRVEAALRSAGLLGISDEARQQELGSLKGERQKLIEQQKSLEQAVKLGGDDAALKDVLARVGQKIAALDQRIAALEAGDDPAAQGAHLNERLANIEAALAKLQAPPQPAPAEAKPLASAAAVAEPEPTKAEEKAKEDKPLGRAGYKDGFFIESADGAFSLKPQSFLDFKLAYAGLEGKNDSFAFSVPFARIALKGTLFTKTFKYNVTTDFAKGNAVLTYYFGDYMVVPDYFGVRVGQQKRPFSRLYIGPSEKSQFISSSAAVKAFGDATDLGIVLHNGQPRFEYAVGMFNGTTSKSVFSGDVEVDTTTGEGSVSGGGFSNVPARFMPAFVARAAANYGKIEGYSEADFEGGPLRASVGVAGYGEADLDDNDKSALRGTVDGLLKYEGLSVNVAAFFGSKQKGDKWGDRELEGSGFVLQAGKLIGEHVEPIARYSLVCPKGADNDTHEPTVGLNLYFFKHNLKWQNDVGASIRPTADETTTDYLYESQLQMMF